MLFARCAVLVGLKYFVRWAVNLGRLVEEEEGEWNDERRHLGCAIFIWKFLNN